MANILIVEDEPDIVLTLEEDLRRQGHQPAHATDGLQGLELGKHGRFDLILLDVMLPKMDGFDVCTELRRAGIAAISVDGTRAGGRKGARPRFGADDYVTKPFSMRELRARIRAQLRRAARSSQQTHRFGECEVDFDRAELRRAGRLVDVTPQELRLLAVLLRNRGRVFSRDQLIASAWGQGVAITDRVVDTSSTCARRSSPTRRTAVFSSA